MILCSYCTINTPYEQEAERLRQSCIDWNSPIDIIALSDQGSWDLNTKLKPYVIMSCMDRHNTDVLYIDADATLHDEIDYSGFGGDIAAHVMDKAHWGQKTDKRCFSLMSGTIWLPNNSKSRALLIKWAAINMAHQKRWDQHNLEEAIGFNPANGKADKYNLRNLPCEYCAIDKTMPVMNNAIIRHHQASRKLRKAGAK